MKKHFKSQLEAIDWIANYAKNEGHFEVLREQLLFNHIYSGKYFVSLDQQEANAAVLLLEPK